MHQGTCTGASAEDSKKKIHPAIKSLNRLSSEYIKACIPGRLLCNVSAILLCLMFTLYCEHWKMRIKKKIVTEIRLVCSELDCISFLFPHK